MIWRAMVCRAIHVSERALGADIFGLAHNFHLADMLNAGGATAKVTCDQAVFALSLLANMTEPNMLGAGQLVA